MGSKSRDNTILQTIPLKTIIDNLKTILALVNFKSQLTQVPTIIPSMVEVGIYQTRLLINSLESTMVLSQIWRLASQIGRMIDVVFVLEEGKINDLFYTI